MIILDPADSGPESKGHPLLLRRDATEKTMKKYRNLPCDFKQADCVRMLRSHLVAMGHKGLPQLPRYSSHAGAVRALKATGHDDLVSLVDSILPRITLAEVRMGDIVAMRGDSGMSALSISVGHKVIGWHESAENMVVMAPIEIEAAWRA